ncbi:MAG: hypothetical protein AB2792_23100 [Candidatus Thiodiazotropha sp.]
MTIAAHNGRCPTCGYDSDEIRRAISDAYDIGVSDTIDAEQRESTSGSKADARDEIVEILFKYIDRMNDLCDEDPADQILEEFTEAVDPAIQRYLDAPD